MNVVVAILGFATIVSAADKKAMALAKAESESFVKVFNEHDAKAVGSLGVETTDFYFLQGDSLENIQFGLVTGRDRITETMAGFVQMCPSAKVTHTVRTARLVTPDVMVVDEDFEITGLDDVYGPIKGQFLVVLARSDGT
jgi:hypothetical protein